MCLSVTYVPKNHEESLVIPVWKEMFKKIINYYTPYYNAKCDNNGLLYKDNLYSIRSERFNYQTESEDKSHSRKFYYYGDILEHHVVHSYYEKPDFKTSFVSEIFSSYAIGVAAYGDSNDVGSIALYIPELDKSKLKGKRANYLKNNEHKISDLMKLFPSLDKLKNDFQILGFKF